MAFFENDGQPRGARAFIQGCFVSRSGKCSWALVLICPACMSGCSNYHTSGPEAWWHEAIGGTIAEQRPPPPGSNDPYPNLATVPPRPPRPNTAEWNQMTAGLITDRIRADQAAALAPIPSSTPRAAAPVARAPSQDSGANAALVGAAPPPAPPGSAKPPKPPVGMIPPATTTV